MTDILLPFQRGTIRFGGTTEFHPGQWAGIELDTDIGKNDGSYSGIRYFSCKPKFGLFVPMHRIALDPRLGEKRKKKLVKPRDATSSLVSETRSSIKELQVRRYPVRWLFF